MSDASGRMKWVHPELSPSASQLIAASTRKSASAASSSASSSLSQNAPRLELRWTPEFRATMEDSARDRAAMQSHVSRSGGSTAGAAADSQLLSPAELELQQALFDLRRQASLAAKVSAFIVFPNVAMAGIVRRLPRSTAALVQLQGIGELTAQRYGAPIIALVEAHCAKHGIQTSPLKSESVSMSALASSSSSFSSASTLKPTLNAEVAANAHTVSQSGTPMAAVATYRSLLPPLQSPSPFRAPALGGAKLSPATPVLTGSSATASASAEAESTPPSSATLPSTAPSSSAVAMSSADLQLPSHFLSEPWPAMTETLLTTFELFTTHDPPLSIQSIADLRGVTATTIVTHVVRALEVLSNSILDPSNTVEAHYRFCRSHTLTMLFADCECILLFCRSSLFCAVSCRLTKPYGSVLVSTRKSMPKLSNCLRWAAMMLFRLVLVWFIDPFLAHVFLGGRRADGFHLTFASDSRKRAHCFFESHFMCSRRLEITIGRYVYLL
jgi:hypothetical protein